MARIRTIKPEFFVSEQIADISPTCRLLFVGMWLFCDDAGIHPASARQLKMEVFPGDPFTVEQMQEMIDELLRVGLLTEYEAQGKVWWQVTGWHHQKIERPRYQHPQPDSTTPRRHVTDISPTPRSLTVPDRTVPENTGEEQRGTKARKRAAFVCPSVEDVQHYADSQGWTFDAGRFVDFYAAKDWKVGKSPMKDWQAAARNANREGWCKLPGASGDECLQQARKRIARTRELCESVRGGGGGGLPDNWRDALQGGTNGDD